MKTLVYNVLLWDINHDKIVPYNIIPYLEKCFKEESKYHYRLFANGHLPETFDDYKKFILNASRYEFWARCEYEFLISGWPPRIPKVDEGTIDSVLISSKEELRPILNKLIEKSIDNLDTEKIDVYEQIKINIDNITILFIGYIKSKYGHNSGRSNRAESHIRQANRGVVPIS